MMEKSEQEIIDRLPRNWQKVFRYLACDQMKAVIFYNDMMFSQYGSRPEWTCLFKALLVEDPYIEKDKLLFKPRLLLLPDKIQEHFYEFLLTHCRRIPDSIIKQFISMIAKYHHPESQTYESFHQLTKTYMVPLEMSETCTKAENNQDLNDNESTTVKLSCDNLLIYLPDITDRSPCSTNQFQVEPFPDDEVIIIDNENDFEKPAKRPRLDSEATESNANELEKLGVEGETEVQINTEELEVKETDISEGTEDLVRRLKEVWLNGDVELPQKELTELSTLSVNGIQSVCQRVDFQAMSDHMVLTVSEHITAMLDCFSYSAIVCLLNNLLYNRIQQLTQNASRQLTHAITLTAGTFQKQFIDAVMIPGFVCESELSSFMGDIYVTVSKESLSSGSRLYFLQHLVNVSKALTENCFRMLQCIIDSGCDFNEDVIQQLLELLHDSGSKFAKDLKVGKLLLSLTNRHGKALKHRDLLEKVVNSNNTFLKKTILTSLKRLKS